METREKILSVVRGRSLPFEDNNLWEEMMKALPDGLCVGVLDFLESSPNGVDILTKNLKEKIAALKGGNASQWEELLRKEKNSIIKN